MSDIKEEEITRLAPLVEIDEDYEDLVSIDGDYEEDDDFTYEADEDDIMDE
jgi:hypothetical protein